MGRLADRFRATEFYSVFNRKTVEGRGCSAIFTNSIFGNMANVFFGGVFYAGFLANNGIDIVRVGIISFIPYIAWALSIFSPKILAFFPKRRWILIGNSIWYYGFLVFGTTLMPMFVQDYTQRTIWFAVFTFAAHAMNALFGSGWSAWYLHFIPRDTKKCNVYVSYQNIGASVVNNGVALLAALWFDTLTPDVQASTISVLRYVAAAVILGADVLLALDMKELPYNVTDARQMRLRDVFTVPFRNRKFCLTTVSYTLWMMIAGMLGNSWAYYLLEDVGMPYSYTLIAGLVYAAGNVLLLPFFRRMIARRSWFRVHIGGMLIYLVPAIFRVLVNAGTIWLYCVLSVLLGVIAVVNNLSYGGMLYFHMPDKDREICTVFWNLMVNVGTFVAIAGGTALLALTEKWQMPVFLGYPLHGAQVLVGVQTLLLLAVTCIQLRLKDDIRPNE